jgi:serine kinase of HPr protein (carbohydrate metabolism regulator)
VALHLQGLLCLHGSGVGIDGSAVAFLANKGAGKSTLATALCAAGATLVTDDMLPVDPRSPVMAWPSMPAVRLP